MKILMFHNKYAEKGGEDTTVANEFNLLKNHGHDVKLFVFDNNGSKVAQFIKFLIYPFNVKSYFRVKKIIKEHKPDIIHLHNFYLTLSPLAFWAIKNAGVPLVVTIQNFRLLCPSAILYHKKSLYLVSLEKKFTLKPAFDRVYRDSFFLTFWLSVSNYVHYKLGTWDIPARHIFVSGFSRDIFERSKFSVYKKKFVTKYNFMAASDEPLNYNREEFFLYIGRLTEEKGIDTLLECFETNGANLKIIGDGALKEKIIASAQKNKNIEYLGFMGKDEILHILKRARALIFPSKWFEGMPLAIIEAFSVGTPVIASDMGAMSEMIIEDVNGYHFLPGSSTDLNKKIRLLNSLSDDRYQQLITECERDFKNRFSEQENLKAITNIYEGALGISPKKADVLLQTADLTNY
jgi:glycosyltransferase involved in cell wall biosynthesis